MLDNPHLPYSQRGLENLAAAMGVNTPMLWMSPINSRLELKEVKLDDENTDEEEESAS
jgi:hypothetical protein